MRRLSYLAVAAVAAALTCSAETRIGGIEFFGFRDLDIAAIRKAVSAAEDAPSPKKTRAVLQGTVKSIVGTDPTDIVIVCCDEAGRRWVYVGLAGSTYKQIRLRSKPREPLRLPRDLLSLHEKLEQALIQAVERGGDAIEEDTSRGYALRRDPTARALELKIREYAVAHGPLVFSVLTSSWNARHRAVAAQAAGYAQHSAEQIRALYQAALDPDKDVRNNAIRALAVLAGAQIELAAPIPASLFIELLSSGIWADRNKAIAVLAPLTRSRDARVLTELRKRALDPLVECARWRWVGHSCQARVILGRVAGIDEKAVVDHAADPTFVDFALSKLRD